MTGNIYRLPVPETAPLPKVGYYTRCPDCGATAMRCLGCGERFTDRRHGSNHSVFPLCESPIETEHATPPLYLAFTHGTSTHLCSPFQRVRLGGMFWWRRYCTAAGVHVHQHCQRCGWRGIALVDNSGPPCGR